MARIEAHSLKCFLQMHYSERVFPLESDGSNLLHLLSIDLIVRCFFSFQWPSAVNVLSAVPLDTTCQLYLNKVTLLGRNTLEEKTGSGGRSLPKNDALSS